MTLRNKLKDLTAPCREVDAEIAVMFDPELCFIFDDEDEPNLAPHYTASLDATAELVEREMPEAEVSLSIYGITSAMVYNGGGQSKEVEHHHKLPAVALILALLDAKEIE